MKFLVDAQLPVRLARFLQASGDDTLHTRDLPQQNATSDSEINALLMQQEWIVITKDDDFVNYNHLRMRDLAKSKNFLRMRATPPSLRIRFNLLMTSIKYFHSS